MKRDRLAKVANKIRLHLVWNGQNIKCLNYLKSELKFYNRYNVTINHT